MRDEPRSRRQPPAVLPAPPGRVDAVEGHALVPRTHQHRHPLRRRFAVDVDHRHLLEEPPMDRELPPLPVVEERTGSPGASFSVHRGPNASAGAIRTSGALDAPLRRGQRRERPERAADHDGGRFGGGGAHGLVHDRSKSSRRTRAGSGPARRRGIAQRAQRLPQQGDLSPAGRRGEAVQVEDRSHAGNHIPESGLRTRKELSGLVAERTEGAEEDQADGAYAGTVRRSAARGSEAALVLHPRISSRSRRRAAGSAWLR